eukprot:PITA_20349
MRTLQDIARKKTRKLQRKKRESNGNRRRSEYNLRPKEKRGGTNLRDPFLATVENLIQQWDLVDFKPVKGEYTWTNNRIGEHHISARLDRFLTSSSIMLNKRIFFSKILLKLTSNHKPILLCLKEEEDLDPLPFRFNPLWAEREGFHDTVQTAWRIEVSGSPSYVWEQKMKNTKKALKEWINKVTITPISQRKDAVNQLEDIQVEMEEKDISSMDLHNEKIAQRKTYNTFRIEEEYWRIKSCSLWLKAGDRNTKYFHRQYRACLSRNHITEIITTRGQVCRGFDQIKEAAVNHFQNLLSVDKDGSEGDISKFLTNIPQLVSAYDNSILLSPVTEEEIANIVWSMEPDKAPGLDGFSIHFYRKCWDLIKTDLIRMVHCFMRKAKIGGGISSTFLALIPKEASLSSFDRYRPISLCNSSYKIMAKLLANRIKPLLQKLISPAQRGFVKGRHILDNVILVQEALHSSHSCKEQGMLIKPDMCNAFDRVNRSYLYMVLSSFGFSHDFINLIKACLEKIWIAPINGRPANFFLATRGLRQGCPLSPILYSLMENSLSRKLTLEKQKGCLPGIRIVKGIDPVNHALFADDSLLLGGASPRIVKSFKIILQKYCSISGALVSERKSDVYGWNTEQHKIETIANALGYTGHADWEKIKYLGLPITLGSNRNQLWEEVISKFKRKITAWGGFWLTTGGKLMLIKSVLSALPTFQASLMLAPKLISDQISKLMRNCLWNGGRGNAHIFHLVSWDMVKRSLAEGGLQIRDLVHANLALGCKLLWKLHAEPSHPVSQIFKLKYLNNQSLKTYNMEKSPKGTQVWKLCNRSIDFFRSHLYLIPGNGKNTKLWRDSVMGHRPLA